MGGGGTPAPPQPVAVPSAADEEAAEERARLYSLLRARRGGRGLAYGPMRRLSLLSLTNPGAKATTNFGPFAPLTVGEGGLGGVGGDFGGDFGGDSSAVGGGYGTGGGEGDI